MIGQRLKTYLKDHGIQQKQLALDAGLTTSQVSRICTAKTDKISCIAYYKICRTLNVPLETFLED